MEANQALLWIIPALPAIGALLAFVIGRSQKDAAGWIATAASGAAFLWTWQLFRQLPEGGVFEHSLGTWLSVGGLDVDFLLRFDALTAVMVMVVTGVGSLIHLYSTAYMAEDESRHRFFSYLNLFMFSMLVLVLAGNLPVLFVGWEGVGLCSYLLIGFWFKNVDYAAAGRKAFVVNRIGDAGFLLGMFLLFRAYGTLDFAALQSALATSPLSADLAFLTALCFFVGATGKSAQIPLFVWLPDAMAGPTPVSALIHAATMVTAGVYLMARMGGLFQASPDAMVIVAHIAVLTAFVAATTALTQNDIKKVLAYSTVSQLGFMFVAAAVGAYWVAIFHVVTHAFFKACLFLGAGSVIHGCHHEQDMRRMGGLWKKMPITAWTYLISTLAIAGIAPFAGYYSKHAITESLAHTTNSLLQSGAVQYLGIMLTVTAFLTAFYMTRSFAMTFLGAYRGHAHAADSHGDQHHHEGGHHEPHESPWAMTLPLVVLAFLALVSGIMLGGAVFGGAYSLQVYLLPVVPSALPETHETFVAALLHSWVGVLGVVLGLLLYTSWSAIPSKLAAALRPLTRLSQHKWYVDEIYAATIVRPLEGMARMLWKGVDQVVIDGSVNGTAAVVDVSGEIVRFSQTGNLRHYAFLMFLGTVVIIGVYLVM